MFSLDKRPGQAAPAPLQRHATPAVGSAAGAQPDFAQRGACPCGGGCPRCIEPADADAQRSTMGARFGMEFGDVQLRTDAQAAGHAAAAGAHAYATRNEIGFASGAYRPDTAEGQFRIAHEFAHVAQFRGGNAAPNGDDIPSPAFAEWQARLAAAMIRAGAAPKVSAFSGAGPLFDKPDGKMDIQTVDDVKVLDAMLKSLNDLPDGDQRVELVGVVVDFAMKPGPARKKALEHLVPMLTGVPNKNFGDHSAAINALLRWVGQDGDAYKLILIGRMWFADHSKQEIGSGLPEGAFRNWLHYANGKYAIMFLQRQATSDNHLTANLAARMTADLLEHENDPTEAKYKASYVALRAMARANGWESFGALGAASATPRIFSALEGVREEADALARMLRRGPVGDPWEDSDVGALNNLVAGLSAQGMLQQIVRGQNVQVFTAENREETEHALLIRDPATSAVYLQEMASAFAIAVSAGARLQARTLGLHENARALNEFLGLDAGPKSDDEQAMFQLRHDYTEVWMSLFRKTFDTGSANIAHDYQARLDDVEERFHHFDQEIAHKKFESAHGRFFRYYQMWNEADQKFSGSDKLSLDFFHSMRSTMNFERNVLTSGFTTTWSGAAGNMNLQVSGLPQGNMPSDLRKVSQLDLDTSIFGTQAAMYLIYVSNLALHAIMLKAEVGDDKFRAKQTRALLTQRNEIEGLWMAHGYDGFLKKSDSYIAGLKQIGEDIKDRAEFDALISIGITILAALLTEGAALAVRLGTLSEIASIARTAEALSSVNTLVEIGVFTAADLTLQNVIFDKPIGVGDVIKSAATNLAFLGAMKAVGKLAEPLAKGSALRKLILTPLIGFAGVAGVSATMTRIESGQWPPDIGRFMLQAGATYLLLAGMHHAFEHFVATPALRNMVSSRLETFRVDNDVFYAKIKQKTLTGTLTRAEFEDYRNEYIRLVEESRKIGRLLKENNAISEADFASVEHVADLAVAGAKGAEFPVGGSAAIDPVVEALPSPDSVDGWVQVGDTNVFVYDPAKASAPADAALARYRNKGFTIEGNSSLWRVVDGAGRTRFTLSAAPVASTRLFLPPGIGTLQTGPQPTLLERASGLSGEPLVNLRLELAKINGDMETALVAQGASGYAEYTVLSTLSMMIEMRSVAAPKWPIDAVRGLADALAPEMGISRAAVRRLFLAVDPVKLPLVLAKYHDIANSPSVGSGARYAIAEDMLPKNSVALIEGWREFMATKQDLPEDMDRQAVRGLSRVINAGPGWKDWLTHTPKNKRAEALRQKSGLVDPSLRPQQSSAAVLADISRDIAGHQGLNALAGPDAETFVKALERVNPAGHFSEPALRRQLLQQVSSLREQAALLQQGQDLAKGQWEGLVGTDNEIRTLARLLFAGNELLAMDQNLGPKRQVGNVDLSAFALPSGGKVLNAPPEKDIHMDFVYKDATGKLFGMETTTTELSLPRAWKGLDPRSPDYGKDIDWNAFGPNSVDGKKLRPEERKIMQAVKIYQFNKMAQTLGTAWSGQPVDPAEIVIVAGDFTADLARALEDMGFKMELLDGTRQTAAQIEARKKGSKTP